MLFLVCVEMYVKRGSDEGHGALQNVKYHDGCEVICGLQM